MSVQRYDLIVIGSGPAGEKGAAQAAYFGKRVALIESDLKLGGSSANTGTLPSKTLRETALHLSGLNSLGLRQGVHFELNRSLTATQLLNRREVVSSVERERIDANLARHRVQVVRGRATFKDAQTVGVLDAAGHEVAELQAERFLIATGSLPHRPSDIPFDDQTILDSTSVLNLKEIPSSMIVVGAGVIGCEYASIFAALGTRIFLLDARDQVLPFLDSEIRQCLLGRLGALGVEFFPKCFPKKVEKSAGQVMAELPDGRSLKAEALLYAAGRTGSTRGLGLEALGIQPDSRGYLKVNEYFQTAVPHIYAAGDVIGFPALASVSMDQGRLATCHAFGFTYRKRLAEHLPMGIYTIPEVSGVGETEESAREKGLDFEVGKASLADNPRAQIMGETGGMLKLIFDASTLRLLGVHLLCERASDLITPGLFALRLGVGIDFLIETVFNYPTISEAYKYAAYNGLGRLAARGRRTDQALV